FVEGKDLRGPLCLVRCERARSLRCEALARQALAYTGRDLVLHGDAARERGEREPALPGDAVELRRRDLTLRPAVPADEDHRLRPGGRQVRGFLSVSGRR